MYYVSWVQMTDERWYLQLDLGSNFTIVSLVCLIVTLYTSLYLDNGWGQLLSFVERLNTHDNFCDKNIKHIVYNVQDYSAVFIIVLFPGCVRVGILLLFGRHLHDRIISLREVLWAHKTCSSSRHFFEAPEAREESEQWCICVMGYRFCNGSIPKSNIKTLK
jgi:hypothetical protein